MRTFFKEVDSFVPKKKNSEIILVSLRLIPEYFNTLNPDEPILTHFVKFQS